MLCSLAGITLNVLVALLLVGPLGFRALALAVVAGTALNFLLLRVLALRRYGRSTAPGLQFLGQVALASAVLGGLGAGAVALWPGASGPGGLATLALIPLLGSAYFLAAAVLRIEEAGWVRRRLFGRGSRPAPPLA